MAAKLTYTCDVCGAAKKETNHWFLLDPPDNWTQGSSFIVEFWYEGSTDKLHLCGEGCLLLKITSIINMKAVSLDE